MISYPASRRARATTLAPRSWPSRPGLAMSIRTFGVPTADIIPQRPQAGQGSKSSEQIELLGLLWRAKISEGLRSADPRFLIVYDVLDTLLVCRGGILSAVHLPVVRHEVGVPCRQEPKEGIPRHVAEIEDAVPDETCARLTGRLYHRGEVLAPVGQLRQHRGQEHTGAHPARGESLDRPETLGRRRHRWLDLAGQVRIGRGDAHADRHLHAPGHVGEDIEVPEDERRTRHNAYGSAEVAQRLQDAARDPITSLDGLIRIGGCPQGNQFALPSGARQLLPQHRRGVRFNEDPRRPLVDAVLVHEPMRAPGVAVVAYDSIGDEVAGSRRNVKEPANARRFDRHNTQLGIVLYRLSLNISLASDGWVDGMEESEVLAETTSDAQHNDGFQPHFEVKLLSKREAEPLKAADRAVDDYRIRI